MCHLFTNCYLKQKKITEKIENDLSLVLEPGVDMGIILHLSFLVDNLLTDKHPRLFNELAEFKKTYRYEMDIVKMNLIIIEKNTISNYQKTK